MVAVPARAQVRLRQLTSSPWLIAVAVVAVTGIVVRVWIYRSVLGIPTADEALALEDTVDIDVFSPPRADWIDGTDSYLR